MFERFTGTARHVVVQAQQDARRLGHNYIGCEHLLLAAAAAAEPAGAVLRGQGVTPERIEAEILRAAGAAAATPPCLPARSGNVPLLPGPFPAAISRSRRAPRRPCSSRCARRRHCTTPTSASSTSPLPCWRWTARFR